MSDLSDQVAIVALVVSLIALLIALTQLLQALASTAEGFRRCAHSVIGPWTDLRRPHFIPLELRVGVTYAAPHITILSGNDKDHERDGVRLISSFWDWQTEPPRRFPWTSREKSELEFRKVLWKTIQPSLEAQPKTQGATDRTDGAAEAEKGMKHVASRRDLMHETVGEIQVSWLDLLRTIHTTYADSWTNSHLSDKGSQSRTDVLVSRRDWNWDFMPPDLLRPLATSRLCDVILLGMRLNMTWRTLNLGAGSFTADGNGFSLTSSELRGLGTVFRFSRNGSSEFVPRKIALSKAADQLMFGIIPGDPDLMKSTRQFPCVDEDRRITGWPPERVLHDLRIQDRGVIQTASEKRWQEPHNDLVMLLSPFMSLEGGRFPWIYTPLWAIQGFVVSPLHLVGGRMALMEELGARVDRTHDAKSDTLAKVLEEFKQLRKGFPEDFMNQWGRTRIEGKSEGESLEKRLELVDECRKVFQRTTEYFQGKDTLGGSYQWHESSEGGVSYLDLVAGHFILASGAVSHLVKTIRYDKEKVPFELREYQEGWGPDRRPQTQYFHYCLAKEYAARMYGKHKLDDHKDTEQDSPLVTHLRGLSRGEDDPSHAAITSAWWVLMLRGVVWNMATGGALNRNPEQPLSWQGEPIPSALYNVETPVWIT